MRCTSGIFVVVAAILSAALSACSSTIHDTARISEYDTLSIDAKQRLVLFGHSRETGRPIVCAEPSPDAIVAISAALAAQGSATLPAEPVEGEEEGGDNTFNAGLGASSSETAASIAMRTATIQVLRDGYYRFCEGLLNGTVQACDYQTIISGIDAFIATVMSVDAVGGMQRAPLVAVTGGVVDVSASATNASATVVGAGPVPTPEVDEDGDGNPDPQPVPTQNVAIGKLKVPAPDASQAVAIRNILAAYLTYDDRMRHEPDPPCTPTVRAATSAY